MTNIIGLDLTDNNSDETRVFINTDNVTHWHHNGSHTVVHFTGGTSINVVECPWEILERIEPEPDYDEEDGAELLGVKHFVLNGELTPGSPVSFHTVMQFDDGSIHDFLTEAVVEETRASDNGVMYHYFRDGFVDGKPHNDGLGFGWPVYQFDADEVNA